MDLIASDLANNKIFDEKAKQHIGNTRVHFINPPGGIYERPPHGL